MEDKNLVKKQILSQEELMGAITNESKKFQECYLWLEKAMPRRFFQEVSRENIMLIAHALMGFNLQNYYSTVSIRHAAIVLCLDSPDSDIKILKDYVNYGIKNYRCFVSNEPAPFSDVTQNLRVATIYFTEAIEKNDVPFSEDFYAQLHDKVMKRNPEVLESDFASLMKGMNARFLKALTMDRLALALDMFFRSKTRDHCQYEVRYNQEWKEKDLPSMQIMLAWRNVQKHSFLYQLAKLVRRYGLVMKRVNATYINPSTNYPILIMGLGLHGISGGSAWDACEIPDFLKELSLLKYFNDKNSIESVFVNTGLLSGMLANLLYPMINFIHQNLSFLDTYIYSIENIEEGFCRHPELTIKLCTIFDHRFNPNFIDLESYEAKRKEFAQLIEKLDTGRITNDKRRKNILLQGLNFVEHILKTNFYRNNKTAYSFRLDPKYLDNIPIDRASIFPELPYGIFFVRGMNYFGFHIRFKDLARGGLRTVFPQHYEQMTSERNTVFRECYNLAYTQQKKNKDIPEGGSKAIIFIRKSDQVEIESEIIAQELKNSKIPKDEIEKRVQKFKEDQKLECLYQSQRSFIEAFLTIINCTPDGKIRSKHILDYWDRPEYIYLGPDENMHNNMIEWIAEFSKKYFYKPARSFISSKPSVGINHKEFGVTSYGVHVYVHETLKFLGIDPEKDTFTIKMTGGPDGDVAGNEILNLYNFFPNTAKLLAITDGSGTINDPEGLCLKTLVGLFKEEKAINCYPPELLNEGGFLLDRKVTKNESEFIQHTLCWKKKKEGAVQEWLTGNEVNALFRNNVHSTKSDIFVPCGGRPRTLNETNYQDFLDEEGKPTSKAIVEGANLYLTMGARRELEKRGVLIIKDSSANKGGVICSSYEVLCGLTIEDDIFLQKKEQLTKEILNKIEYFARQEALLLLKVYKETGESLLDLSNKVSQKINQYTYEVLDYLEPMTLSDDPNDPLIKEFLAHAPETLSKNYEKELLANIPDHHKKAIISCNLAGELIYKKGLNWAPSIVDILPLILKQC